MIKNYDQIFILLDSLSKLSIRTTKAIRRNYNNNIELILN
jgi:hypothetical protein